MYFVVTRLQPKSFGHHVITDNYTNTSVAP